MCEIKQINSANEDVPPQWCYLWYMQAFLVLDFLNCEIASPPSADRNDVERIIGLQICFMEQNGTTDEHLITCPS